MDPVQPSAPQTGEKIQNTADAVNNGLGAAIGFNATGFGFPQNQGSPFTAPVSDVTTAFINLRWYLVSNMRQFLCQLYVETGLVQTICDVPVDDALRGGVEIKSKQLSEEQLEELKISLDRDDDLNVVGQAAKWNRLFGGAGVIVLTDQDPETPLDMQALNDESNIEFRAVDMWELFWDKQNTEGYDPAVQSQDFEFYNYYGEQIHKSRVMRMKGMSAPSFIRPRLRGWGMSVIEALIRSMNQYFKSTDLSFQVLDEFKIDVYKIKNLINTLASPLGEEQVAQRIKMANWQKNYQNALVMDSEDDWDHKQLSFAGLAEAQAGIRMQVASDMRMPLTKLFGISAAGFNSGEDDIEVYNSMVESTVRGKIKYDILRVLEIKCQVMFGFVPDDLAISFKPLRVMSSEQEENVKTQKFTRAVQARQLGEISSLEFRQTCNKGGLFDITLDTDSESLAATGPDDADEGRQNPDKPVDTDDPGADRADTRKARADEEGDEDNPDKTKGGEEPGKGKVLQIEGPEAEGKAHKGVRGGKVVKEGKDLAPDAPFPPDAPSRSGQRARNARVMMVGPDLVIAPKPFSFFDRVDRILSNSAAFDRASYEADGGDAWIDPRRKELFSNPNNVDGALWRKSKEASVKVFGKEKWQFITWFYKKQGGKFT